MIAINLDHQDHYIHDWPVRLGQHLIDHSWSPSLKWSSCSSASSDNEQAQLLLHERKGKALYARGVATLRSAFVICIFHPFVLIIVIGTIVIVIALVIIIATWVPNDCQQNQQTVLLLSCPSTVRHQNESHSILKPCLVMTSYRGSLFARDG